MTTPTTREKDFLLLLAEAIESDRAQDAAEAALRSTPTPGPAEIRAMNQNMVRRMAAFDALCALDPATVRAAYAEVVKLRCDLAHERQSHSNTIDSRDRMHEAADRLAYAAFDIDDIGEHSSANCPWENAAELLEEHAGGIHELVFGPALPTPEAQ